MTGSFALLDLFAEDAVANLDVAKAPTDGAIGRIAVRARELDYWTRAAKRAEELLASISARKTELAQVILPKLMEEAGADSIGMSDAGADLVLAQWVSASISRDWTEEARQAAFAHLEELGGGDLVKAEVDVPFGREDLELAKRFAVAARTWLTKAKRAEMAEAVAVDMSVHSSTLTAFVKRYLDTPVDERPKDKPPLRLEVLGAKAGAIAKIVRRKEKKPRGKSRGK